MNRAILTLLLCAVMTTDVAAKSVTRGPFTFACVGDSAEALTVTFLGVKADRARLTYKGETVVAKHALSADGGLYTAKDVEFWNKGDDGVLEWRGEKAKCALDK
jgi:membrane-bound inhibitor of C-type lysozyme